MPKVAVFIDGASFSIACRRAHSGLPDYGALGRLIARRWNHTLGPIFYYDSLSSHPSSQARQRKFWQVQRERGITLKLGRTEPNHDGSFRQKEVDVMIACDLLTGAFEKSFDRAALVSGDTDFAYAIECAGKLGVEVGWVYLPIQEHLDRLKNVVPAEWRVLIDAKTFRLINQFARR